ncbi:Flavin-binding monooxygenase [Venustampulla echinocandica]|uniref:Flavin-binding monooxygenase n=1 Tax=Venustampulla echinocandica TaxID=2656787 RepID=A0A370TSK8_9HELO|nr:Flavin-binding monooxygenase [Venustampulla echinocandica]RDL38519.1 Flavin-binding monooxygenase [Venustampulla echinocandica]
MGSYQPFTIKDEPVENQRPLKVRVIGAGYSGIYLGIRIPQRLRNIDLQIYEKNDGVGGTWWENRYPGCACDVPSHSYQYTFDPNPDWSSFYAPAPEICAYLQKMADKYGVMRYVKLSHKITNCKWDEATKKWNITVENTKTGEIIEDDADILLSARGNLNDFKWPDIPGFDTFSGDVTHSAAWNQKVDFTNKRVGVIGGGSSSIQLVPKLQKLEGVQLTCFVRSKTWISNPFGDNAMVQLGLDPKKFEFSDEQRKEFASDPEKFLKFRKAIEADGNTIHAVTLRDSEIQKGAVEAFQAMMKERLVKKPEIAQFLIPSFAVGCRRLTPGPGYLEALVEDNVNFVTEEISSITPKGIVLSNGETVEIDVLVCATGFKTGAPPPFQVYGKGGVSLEEKFKPYPETYLSVGVDGFPNFFMMLGPNSAIGAGSLTTMIENEGDYIVKCIRKLQKEDYVSMTPKAERVKDFSEFCGEYFKNTVYMDNCNSWYRSEGGKGNRITGLWPGSSLHCLETLRTPRWEDFEYESKDENKLRWIGNGWSMTHIENGGDPAWYLEPSMMSIPLPGHPEEDEEYKKRPFSH